MASKKGFSGGSKSSTARASVAGAVKTAPSQPSASRSSWIAPEELDALLEVMGRHDASELELERMTHDGSERLTLRRGSASVSYSPQLVHEGVSPARPTHSSPIAPPPNVDVNAASEDGMSFVASPLVGTFYRAPSPDTASFVEIGSTIRPGQRLCIVEAMKLMNEIESEIEGTIVEILVENGKPVEFGQKLFKVKKG